MSHCQRPRAAHADRHARRRAGGRGCLAATAATVLLAACSGGTAPSAINVKPSFVGPVSKATYDGATDDLLTAGLGKTGLAAAAPTAASPTAPTPAELRKIAIWNNYRAIVDIAANGGYGSLYGPNIDSHGQPTPR